MTSRVRLLRILSLLLLSFAACGGDTPAPADSTPTPEATEQAPPGTTKPAGAGADATVIQVDIEGDAIRVVEDLVEVELGTRVRIEATADRSDEVHVHGYDLSAQLTPGEMAVIEFEAGIPGTFEVELEGSHELLFELRVR